jgi:hypothetical protein
VHGQQFDKQAGDFPAFPRSGKRVYDKQIFCIHDAAVGILSVMRSAQKIDAPLINVTTSNGSCSMKDDTMTF